jgi:hypothetical protein
MIQTFIVQFKIHDMAGADPGFVVRRGIWGPLKGPQWVQGRVLVGSPGGEAPWKLWRFEELQTFI